MNGLQLTVNALENDRKQELNEFNSSLPTLQNAEPAPDLRNIIYSFMQQHD